MQDGDEVRKLLAEIRDLQREHLTEYKAFVQEALELQRTALARYERLRGIYGKVVFVAGGLVLLLLALLAYLLVKWGPYLLGT